MNCKKCGTILNANDTVCRVCGEPFTIDNMSQTSSTVVEQPMQQSVAEPTVASAPVQQSVMESTITDNMTTPSVQPPKKKNSLFIIIVTVLIIAIVAVGVVIALKMMNKETKPKNDDNIVEPVTPVEPEPEQKQISTIYGYDFVIPNDLTYEAGNNVITVSEKTNRYKFLMTLTNTTYTANLTDQTILMKDMFGDSPYTIGKSQIMKSGTRNYYLVLVTCEGINYYVYATDFQSKYIASGVVTANITSDYSTALDQITAIVDSASNSSSFGASNLEINNNDLSQYFNTGSSSAELQMD